MNNRRTYRILSLVFLLCIGALLIFLGYGDSAQVLFLGCFMIVIGLLGIFGVNIWARGPLDPRNEEPTSPRNINLLDNVQSFGMAIWAGFMQWGIVFMSVMIVMGIVFFCRIPYLAKGAAVKPGDVAIRCLDWHQAEPFYLIEGYDEAVKSVEIPWKFNQRDIRKIETQQSADGKYRHTVYNTAGGAAVDHVESLTPHTLLTQAQIEEAHAGLTRLYSPADRAVWMQVLAWGEGLFLQWWSRNFDKEAGYNGPVVEPWAGTEDEKIWFAWQRLSAGTIPSDLPRLGALMREAYPVESDYQEAMTWARVFHQRREDYYRSWLTSHRRHSAWETRFHGPIALPPAEDVTLWWIVYQYVGLHEESRIAATKRWLQFFPNKKDVALRWGQSLETARRQTNDPLPPAGANVPLVCVIERLTGWDAYGVQSRQVALQVLDPLPERSHGSSDTFTQTAIAIGYPSDEIFMLQASGDALNLVTLPAWDMLDRSRPLSFLLWFLMWLLLLGVILFLLRCAILDTLGGRLLGMMNHDRFRAYYTSQTTTNRKALRTGLILAPLFKWGWEWWKLAPPNELLMPTVFHLLAGVYMGVLAGGLILLLINRIVAVFLLRFGYDVEKSWLDEIISTTLGTILLAYFGNEWSSLLAFAAAAALPEAFKRWWKLKHPPPTLLSPTTLTQAAGEHLRQTLVRDAAGAKFIRVYSRPTELGPMVSFDPEEGLKRPGDRLFVSQGVNLVVNDAQLEALRGLVVDFAGDPPGLVVFPQQDGSPQPPIVPDVDETVYEREPLMFEEYPIACWSGLALGVAMGGLFLVAMFFSSE